MARFPLLLVGAVLGGCAENATTVYPRWSYELGQPPGNAPVALEPPAPRPEAIPAAPLAGALWSPGYWDWIDEEWVWVGGTWLAPRDGWQLLPASYARDDGRLHVVRPRWQRTGVTLGEDPSDDGMGPVIAPRAPGAPMASAPGSCGPCDGGVQPGWVSPPPRGRCNRQPGVLPGAPGAPEPYRPRQVNPPSVAAAPAPYLPRPSGNAPMPYQPLRPSASAPMPYQPGRPSVAMAPTPLLPRPSSAPPAGWPGPTAHRPSAPASGTLAPPIGAPRMAPFHATTPGIARVPIFPARR